MPIHISALSPAKKIKSTVRKSSPIPRVTISLRGTKMRFLCKYPFFGTLVLFDRSRPRQKMKSPRCTFSPGGTTGKNRSTRRKKNVDRSIGSTSTEDVGSRPRPNLFFSRIFTRRNVPRHTSSPSRSTERSDRGWPRRVSNRRRRASSNQPA